MILCASVACTEGRRTQDSNLKKGVYNPVLQFSEYLQLVKDS